MHPLPRTLLTTALCATLGAVAGQWRAATPDTAKAADTPAKRSASITQTTTLAPVPPPFTSITASAEWVWRQIAAGHLDAAELLFRNEAGLTPEQRLDLATTLVREFRRMEPRVLARIVLGLPRSQHSDRLLSQLIAEWCRYDADDALRFLEVLPADRLNSMPLLVQAAFGLTRLPAERVLAFSQQLDDKGRAFLAEGLMAFADQAGAWSNTASILGAMTYTPHEEALQVEWRIGLMLGQDAPAQVEQRIQTEADPAKRDQLLLGYIDALGSSHLQPDQDLAWAAQISDPQLRKTACSVQIMRWLRYERDAALDWLRSENATQLIDQQLRDSFLSHYQPAAEP